MLELYSMRKESYVTWVTWGVIVGQDHVPLGKSLSLGKAPKVGFA